jgi:hypothetical protein
MPSSASDKNEIRHHFTAPTLARWYRADVQLCLGVLGLAAVSWARFLFTATLALESAAMPLWATVAQWSLFGLCASVAALSFLRLCSMNLEPRRLLRLAVVLHLCAAPALPLTSSDMFCNLAYGHIAALGENPYTFSPLQLPDGDPFRAAMYERWVGYPTAYGPAVAFFDVAAGTARSLGGALAVFKLEMLVATLLALFLGAAICRITKGPFVLLACNPLIAWELSGQAHNDALIVLGLCGFLLGALRQRWLPALAALALALWTKPAGVPVCGLVLVWQLRESPRRALAAALGLLAAGVLLYAPFWAGPSTLAAILRELRGDPGHLTHSLTGVFYELGGLLAYRVASASSALLLAFLALRGIRRATSLEETARGAAHFYLALGLWAAPWMQAWYISWIPPLLLVAPDSLLIEVTAVWSGLALVQYAIPLHTATAVVVNGVPLWLLVRRRLRARAAAA